MIYITQLIYKKAGQEKIFDQFESVAIPTISKYKGRLLFRVKPAEDSFIEINMEQPYEIHFVEFNSEKDFNNFYAGRRAKIFLHLKEQSKDSLATQG
ncbi:MAG: DUF1330 domain-containing protein [Flammeovirgaceae bacterium]|nr:DUF1330 domain-containing protein [Flammeovirgaceae bacterium]